MNIDKEIEQFNQRAGEAWQLVADGEMSFVGFDKAIETAKRDLIDAVLNKALMSAMIDLMDDLMPKPEDEDVV